jgi:hypothetical protein
MAFANINRATPVGSDKGKVLDDEIRALKTAVKTNFGEISNYRAESDVQPSAAYLRTSVWHTAERPSGTDRVDRVNGYNLDLGCEEYYDTATETWQQKGSCTAHGHAGGLDGPPVSTAGIADNAVTTEKIAAAAITNGKLADDAVDTAKIADGSVTVDKMAAGAIGGNIAILAGTISHGGTIPLPAGYTEAQCYWMVSLRTQTVDDDDTVRCFTTGRVVSIYTSQRGGGTANYMIIGIK